MFEDKYTIQIEIKFNLKKCPFCGRDAIVLIHKGFKKNEFPNCQEGALKGLYYVGCPEPITQPVCEITPAAKWYTHLKDAVKQWNNRKEK